MADIQLPGQPVWGEVDKTVLAVLTKNLERIDDLSPRIDVIVTAPARVGSVEATEMASRLRAYGYDQARTSMRVAIDHLYAWRHLLCIAELMPLYAHFSILRTAHEAALTAYWLVEPGIDAAARLSRGVAAQAADYEERRKFEEAAKLARPAKGKLAVERMADLMKAARNVGLTKNDRKGREILALSVPGTVELFDRYEPFEGGGSPQWLYRFYSGYAHAKQWALYVNAERQTAYDSSNRAIALSSPDERVAAAITIRVIDSLERALTAYEELRV